MTTRLCGIALGAALASGFAACGYPTFSYGTGGSDAGAQGGGGSSGSTTTASASATASELQHRQQHRRPRDVPADARRRGLHAGRALHHRRRGHGRHQV
ncbi:MAG: hypothetical protein QM820_47945 [Minicystis sp.]